jgi:phage-related protein
MAIGFTTSAAFGAKAIRPDKSLSRSSKPKVHLATFGDGYEQRLADGINSVKETFSVAFQTRTKADIDDIVGYLDSLQGVTAFDFTIPDSNVASPYETTVKVVCDDFSITYDYGDFYSASASFRRVYEA